MRCRTRWVTVVSRGFVDVVLSDLSTAIVLRCIARVFIEGKVRFGKDGFYRSST